jgi:recombination protein RecT
MAEATKLPAPILELRQQLETRAPDMQAALPKGYSAEFFQRVIINGVARKPSLLKADRASLLIACQNAAVDGLLPDGREGALVEFWDDRNKIMKIVWLPMAVGIRKKIRQSGDIDGVECHCVYTNDEFFYQLGDEPKLVHRPALDEPGPMVRVYSIARFKSGYITREIMSRAQVEKIRDRSNAWRGAVAKKKTHLTPWGTDFDEMARKTVLRRHAKQLPMSRDIERVMARGEALFSEEATALPAGKTKRLTTGEGLARIAGNGQADDLDAYDTDGPEIEGEVVDTTETKAETKAKRTPHQATKAAPEPEPEPEDDTPAEDEDETVDESDNDGELSEAEQDFRLGESDFAAGNKTCRDPAVKASKDRLQRWQSGFKAAFSASTSR